MQRNPQPRMRPPFYLGFLGEDAAPDKVCVSRTWDRDAAEVLGSWVSGPRVPERVVGSTEGWCPPIGKEFVRQA